MIKIAMIEDDVELAEVLSEYLAKFDIFVTNYEDPFVALSDIPLNEYDLIILDLSLPGMDGLEVCKKLIARNSTPIIISSARSDITDKVVALKIGADDYLPKPYDPRELEVRIKSVLRRCSKNTFLLKDREKIFAYDEEKQSITKNKVYIKFTQAETQLMSFMCERSGFIVSRYDILEYCNLLNSDESSGSIAVIIGRIRAKIEDNPKKPKYFLTIRGMGYKLINDK